MVDPRSLFDTEDFEVSHPPKLLDALFAVTNTCTVRRHQLEMLLAAGHHN